MTKDEFTRLFSYMEERFQGIDDQFAAVWRRFDKVDQRFDEQAKMILDNKLEITALGARVERIEDKLEVAE